MKTNDSLHGVTLEQLLRELVDCHGWEALGQQVNKVQFGKIEPQYHLEYGAENLKGIFLPVDKHFKDVIDEIFSKKTKQESINLIKEHSRLWMQFQSGSQGISGKKTINSMTMFDQLFEVQTTEPEVDEEEIDSDEAMSEVIDE